MPEDVKIAEQAVPKFHELLDSFCESCPAEALARFDLGHVRAIDGVSVSVST